MERIESDVLIIGCGISGLTAAITAAEKGLTVNILTKARQAEESNTWYAQGGIVGLGEKDSPALLLDDIMSAGSHINYRKAVELVSTMGPRLVDSFLIDKVKVPFARSDNGELLLTREGAHSTRRIYHFEDRTGQAIIRSLLVYAEKTPGIRFFTGHMAIDIITNCHHSSDSQEKYRKQKALGAYALKQDSGEVRIFFAPAVVLATGGLGQVFQHTSNPRIATGDGVAMAWRAGAGIINSEYVQFHPTTLFHRDLGNFLISEAVRGEGARLINRAGIPFMKDYHHLGDLAPRDEVSIAIYREMDKTGARYVLLDATGIKSHDPAVRFPGIHETCLSVGIDIRTQPIPVVPAAHYFCGGIKVTPEGRTDIDGLYAIGETACTGVHGANRLASVSLLEGLLFGHLAANSLAASLKHPGRKLLQSIPDWIFPREEDEFDPALIKSDFESIRTLMWNYTGIIRSRDRLNRALADLNYLSHRIEKFYRKATLGTDLVEMRNAVVVSALITKSALTNTRSIGCHYIR
jgi:L-aspartate oxidase